MKIRVTLETELTIEFDENSEEFKELYENYKKYIHNSDYEEFAEDICNHIARYGANESIECVGDLKINGRMQYDYIKNEKIECPINIIGNFDINEKCEFETSYTEVIDD